MQQALGEDGLDLLLNVAGVANVATGVIEGLPLEDLPKVFEINTFGQVRTIQFFLPMLRRAKPPARILNFGSGAVLANPPIAGAYNMSKHAVHGLTLTLRHELAAFGIQVASIWPGGVKTNMTHNAHANTLVVWTRCGRTSRQPTARISSTRRPRCCPTCWRNMAARRDYVTDQVLKIVDLPQAEAGLSGRQGCGTNAVPAPVAVRQQLRMVHPQDLQDPILRREVTPMSAIREAAPISDAKAAFDRLAAKAPALARTSAAERTASCRNCSMRRSPLRIRSAPPCGRNSAIATPISWPSF